MPEKGLNSLDLGLSCNLSTQRPRSHRSRSDSSPSWFLFLYPHQMSKLTVFCHVFSFLKSTAPRPEVSSLINLKGNANCCPLSDSLSCHLFEVKLTGASPLRIFRYKTVRCQGEKMPAVCLREEVVVCMSCPAPSFLKAPTVGCLSCSLSSVLWPFKINGLKSQVCLG